MEIFLTLLAKLCPLYFFLAFGFLAARWLRVDRLSVARILIYIVAPLVVFYGVVQTELSLSTLSLPFLFYILCCIFALLFYGLGQLLWGSEKNKGLLAYVAGDGNTGYFGLPVALILFGDEALGLVILCALGFILFENTLGFFLMARGNYSLEESLRRLVKLPTLYAFFAGVLFQALHLRLPDFALQSFDQAKGAYTVLGMMIIGMGLAAVRWAKLDYTFMGVSFFAKFVLWPVVMLLLIWLDKNFIQFYGEAVYPLFLLMGIVPMAANAISFATELDVHPEKAALTVTLSTFFALFYIPVMVSVFL